MAKQLPKDVDLAGKINPADGFFTDLPEQPHPDEENDVSSSSESDALKTTNPPEQPRPDGEKDVSPSSESDIPKTTNVGGRPRKEGLKNEQFTLTMHPELYEKLRIISGNNFGGNFSRLIDEAVKVYCTENEINLDDIKVPAQILNKYKERQEKRKERKSR